MIEDIAKKIKERLAATNPTKFGLLVWFQIAVMIIQLIKLLAKLNKRNYKFLGIVDKARFRSIVYSKLGFVSEEELAIILDELTGEVVEILKHELECANV